MKVWILALLLGCAEQVAPPGPGPVVSPLDDWERLLVQATRGGGVDWRLLADQRATLDDTLAWYAEHGPESSRVPESHEDERLASLLNIYDAEVVGAVLDRVWTTGADPSLLHVPTRQIGHHLAFRVDNEWITLDRLAVNRVLAIFEEPEIHGALYRGTAEGPRLRYFRAETLRSQLLLGLYDWLNRDGGLRKVGDAYALTADLAAEYKDFRDWDGAGNLCMALVEYTSGEAQRWMVHHLEDCPLRTFEPEDRLDGLTRP